jgi:hypothetical protein
MKNETYKQCRFRKFIKGFHPGTGDYHETVAYIQSWAAVVGNRVQLLSLDGEFWEVTEVSKEAVSHDFIRENERNYKEFQGSTRGGGIDQ